MKKLFLILSLIILPSISLAQIDFVSDITDSKVTFNKSAYLSDLKTVDVIQLDTLDTFVPIEPLVWSEPVEGLCWDALGDIGICNNENGGLISDMGATEYCSALTEGDLPTGSWSLPTRAQLAYGLADLYPDISENNGWFDTSYYWSNLQSDNYSDFAWVVFKPSGSQYILANEANKYYPATFSTRCVRVDTTIVATSSADLLIVSLHSDMMYMLGVLIFLMALIFMGLLFNSTRQK